jgi:hypothetical protein
MLTDRISLELALSYLTGVRDTYTPCKIIDVMFSYTNAYTNSPKTWKALDLLDLEFKIDVVAPKMTTLEAECTTMGIYELRYFKVEFTDGTYAILENRGSSSVGGWVSNNQNIYGLTKVDLNEYQRKYNEVYNLYTHVYDNEYINKQLTYVSCKYIQTLFGPIIDQINEKYNKPGWHLKK